MASWGLVLRHITQWYATIKLESKSSGWCQLQSSALITSEIPPGHYRSALWCLKPQTILTFVFPVLLLIFHCRSCFMFSHLSCGQYHRCHVRGWGKNNLQQPQTLSGSCQTCGVVSSIKVIAFYNLDLREVPQGKYWWKHWGLTPVGAVGQWVLQVALRSIRDMCKLHISASAAGGCGQSGWSSIGHIHSKQAKELGLAKDPWETLKGPLTLDERKPHAIMPPTKNVFIVCLSEGECKRGLSDLEPTLMLFMM